MFWDLLLTSLKILFMPTSCLLVCLPKPLSDKTLLVKLYACLCKKVEKPLFLPKNSMHPIFNNLGYHSPLRINSLTRRCKSIPCRVNCTHKDSECNMSQWNGNMRNWKLSIAGTEREKKSTIWCFQERFPGPWHRGFTEKQVLTEKTFSGWPRALMFVSWISFRIIQASSCFPI